ncbi:hypothetical protein Aduo_012443 [Ancylostoma duodenale]
MAAQVGLHTLVADGPTHSNPVTLNAKASCTRKMGCAATGSRFSCSMRSPSRIQCAPPSSGTRNELGAAVPPRLRLVLDYEKAAINAVKWVFPHATVQGCAFHFHWEIGRDMLGLRRFIKGAVGVTKSLEVERWSEEFRKSNLAESYHSQMNTLVDGPSYVDEADPLPPRS